MKTEKVKQKDLWLKVKTECDPMSVEAIVKEIHGATKSLTDSQNRRTMLIWYLTRDRFREYPGYRHASKEDFVSNICGVAYSTFLEQRNAITRFPDESKTYGARFVAKVVSETRDPEKTFERIRREQDKHKKVLPISSVKEMVKADKKPPKEKPPHPPPAEVINLRDVVREKQKEIERLIEENKKLKAAVRDYKKKYEDLLAGVNSLPGIRPPSGDREAVRA